MRIVASTETIDPRYSFRKDSILFLNGLAVMPLTMKDQIWARIEGLGPGKAFMAKDFLDIASRGSIDVALTNLTSSGKIRRIRRGTLNRKRG